MRQSLCLFLFDIALLLTAVMCPAEAQTSAKTGSSAPIVVTVHTDRSVGRFRPSEAFGAGVDGHEKGSIAPMYTPANLKAMLTAGFKPLTYRLRSLGQLGANVVVV